MINNFYLRNLKCLTRPSKSIYFSDNTIDTFITNMSSKILLVVRSFLSDLEYRIWGSSSVMYYCKLYSKAKSLQAPPTGAFGHCQTTSAAAVSFISAPDTSTYPASLRPTPHLICKHVRIEARQGSTVYNSSAFFFYSYEH